MSVDLSGEITAIATAVLAVFAIVTAIYAIRAFRKQSQEVSDQANMLQVQSDQLAEQRKVNEKQIKVLELQGQELGESLTERKREAEQRRRAQASRVFISEERGASGSLVTASVVNTSQQPVYNVIISWHLGHRPEGQHYLTPLMPGHEATDSRRAPPDTDPTIFGATAFFRDAAGMTWRTRPDGQLEEITPGQEPPHTW
jgi:hypothetical protein